jgi:hypothetical protein
MSGAPAGREGARPTPVAFYCVANDRYFLGAVGLINSLRLVGHREPIFLLDCGLTPRQRELLEPRVTLVSAPEDAPPWLLKTVAPLRHPAEVSVLIDADMIVTRPLGGLIEKAASGRVVAFRTNRNRLFPEWGELLDLGPIRRQPYLSSGLVVFAGRVAVEVLRLMADRMSQVDFDLTYPRRSVPDYPFLMLDQDVLNAILASRVDPERIVVFEHRLAPKQPFAGIRLLDEKTLRCAYAEDAAQPYVLHWLGLVKPWLERTREDIYSRLLVRLLTGPDVGIKVPDEELPLRWRRGLLGRAERARLGGRERIGWLLRNHLPDGIVSRFDAFRLRRGAGGL